MKWWSNRIGVACCAAALVLAGCRDREQAASDELTEAGYRMTADDWFRDAANDQAAVLERFVKGGYAVDLRDAAGDTALHAAAAAGAEKAAKFLLDRKLPVDITGASGRTPLMVAVMAGKASMTRWLLRQGADPKKKDADGFRPLMLAVKEGRHEVLGDLAAVDRAELDDALLVASLLGKTKVIDVLTSYGASVYARMDDGRTPLMLAAENGHQDAAKLLVDLGANRFAADSGGKTAADLAADAGHEPLARMLRSDPAPEEFTLHTEQQLGEEMAAVVARVERAEAVEGGPSAPARSSPGAVVSLSGQTLGRRDAGQASAPAAGAPALVMRQFRQRELPLEVRHVEAGVARIAVKDSQRHEWKVKEGERLAGTRLKVLRIQRRMESGKENFGRPVEVSVVEVEDTATGARRNLVAGVAATAHDPVALVEDSATGKRYTAAPGQTFTGADGIRYTVSDVRPNQIVIEETGTRRVQTLPLRGPRG
ncbi:MAG TPA: ankyrin repeat domain-containing protein [Luteolibacter sp.]